MNTIKQQVEILLETMQEQFQQIKQYETEIPQIELDILLSNLRKTYEFVVMINKLNDSEEVPAPAINVIKKEIFKPTAIAPKVVETPQTIETPKIVEVPVVMETPLATQKTSIIEALMEIPVVMETPVVEKQEMIAEPIVSEPVMEKPIEIEVVSPSPLEMEIEIEEEEIFEIPILESPIMTSPAVETEPVFEITPPAIQEEKIKERQEIMNIQREKAVAKEESFVQKINPIAKIVSLFDDNDEPQDRQPRESVSILDKIMRRTEDSSVATKLKNAPITDLKSAIGINEKFQFINELFAEDAQDFNASLEILNKCKTYTDAEIFIAENLFAKYGWDIENKCVISFMNLIERRFLQ